jgi:hypothetical protein
MVAMSTIGKAYVLKSQGGKESMKKTTQNTTPATLVATTPALTYTKLMKSDNFKSLQDMLHISCKIDEATKKDIKIFFDKVPNQKIREILKSNDFKWRAVETCWRIELKTQKACKEYFTTSLIDLLNEMLKVKDEKDAFKKRKHHKKSSTKVETPKVEKEAPKQPKQPKQPKVETPKQEAKPKTTSKEPTIQDIIKFLSGLDKLVKDMM